MSGTLVTLISIIVMFIFSPFIMNSVENQTIGAGLSLGIFSLSMLVINFLASKHEKVYDISKKILSILLLRF